MLFLKRFFLRVLIALLIMWAVSYALTFASQKYFGVKIDIKLTSEDIGETLEQIPFFDVALKAVDFVAYKTGINNGVSPDIMNKFIDKENGYKHFWWYKFYYDIFKLLLISLLSFPISRITGLFFGKHGFFRGYSYFEQTLGNRYNELTTSFLNGIGNKIIYMGLDIYSVYISTIVTLAFFEKFLRPTFETKLGNSLIDRFMQLGLPILIVFALFLLISLLSVGTFTVGFFIVFIVKEVLKSVSKTGSSIIMMALIVLVMSNKDTVTSVIFYVLTILVMFFGIDLFFETVFGRFAYKLMPTKDK